jgi:hypothetical protein
MGRHEQVVRWVVHSYLSREGRGRWVGARVQRDITEWADMNRLCRWVMHSYLSRHIHTGGWVGGWARACVQRHC